MAEGLRLHVSGVVQGVGFRPFVYGLAARYALTGWVCNTGGGVDLELNGDPSCLQQFRRALQTEAPPLAQIEAVDARACVANGYERFEIRPSLPARRPEAVQPVSPDVSLCDDCRRELLDPSDRRYRYPFINCTNCGPRYTIITAMPYDRPATTMAHFPLCAQCAAEYADPLDRRFHAQPVACPLCGPNIWLEQDDGAGRLQPVAYREEALQAARRLLAQGSILALKGLGGFHLACDATDNQAVHELRRRKQRPHKPLALMMPDLAAVAHHCLLDPAAEALLLSGERPIVLLPARRDSPLTAACAPGQQTLGVMLPYTPLHLLLLERASGFPDALIMTSGNRCAEPIVFDDEQARALLAPLADALLLHDRPIHAPCDDSVVSLISDGSQSSLYPLRRARGYAPQPIHLPRAVPDLLAVGAEQKNTFCLARGRHAFLSPHVGDLQNMETLQAFERGVARLQALFGIQPRLLAHDLHPDYLSTRYALARAAREGLPALAVQHHHAHLAALMAEHGLGGENPVLGVIFDGAGYGSDGAIWGGEFLVADYAGFRRPYHLASAPLPGGDLAVRQPWRHALSWLAQAGLPWDEDLPPLQHGRAQSVRGIDALPVLQQQLARSVNCPQTTSMGRLFDAVAALAGVRQQVTYEGQAAIELEALVDPTCRESYEFALQGSNVDPAPLLQALVADLRHGLALPILAARFHNGVARMVLDICCRLRAATGLDEVALAGGVWQNRTLLQKTRSLLAAGGFTVYVHRRVPANDGGLALGQAMIAAHSLQMESANVPRRTR